MNFRTFIAGINPKFFINRNILLNVADEMQAFYFDKSKKVLNVSMPPRFGKSYLATLFSVWLFLFVDKKLSIMRICNTQELFNTFSRQTRQTFEDFSPMANNYLKIATNGTIDKWYIGDSIIPNYFGAGISGNVTGFGAKIGIFDDMYRNYQDAVSPAYDSFLDSYLQGVIYGRMEGDNYKIINIGTRWATNDWFSKFKPDHEIVIPALAEDGLTTCEDYKDTSELIDIKSKIEPYLWDAQYMQQPTLQGRSKIFDIQKFHFVNQKDIPKNGNTYAVLDPATDYGNDYFVIGTYLKNRGQLYLIDIWANQSAKLSDVANVLKLKEYKRIFIETNGYGKEVYRRLVADYKIPDYMFLGFSTKTDKYSRASMTIEFIEENLSISNEMNNLDLLKSQTSDFPLGSHDDLIDNVVQACENFSRMI